MEWHNRAENALTQAQAAGYMTRREADILYRRLDSLALNLTMTGHRGAVPRPVAAYWMIHLQRRYAAAGSAISPHQLARASRWWTLASDAGLLCVTAQEVAFVELAEQRYFCLHYFQTHALDARLLHHTTYRQFASLWRYWARQDPSVVERLIALLRGSAMARARARAAVVLGYVGDARALDPLMSALGDPSNVVRVAATEAAAAFGDPAIMQQLARNLVQEQCSLRPRLSEALGRAGEPAVPLLLELLAHPDWLVRRAAVIGLGWTRSALAVAPLLTYPVDPLIVGCDMYTSQHVEVALTRLGEVAVPHLVAALGDKRPGIAIRARRILEVTHPQARWRMAARESPPGASP